MAITEKEALDALKGIPRDSWLFRYVEHGYLQSTTPIGYHIAVGLTILAATEPMPYSAPWPPGRTHGNLFSMLVGRSGDDQKSTALGIGRDIFSTACPNLLGHNNVSEAAMIDMLVVKPKVVVFYSEFGTFMSSAKNMQHMVPVKTMITDLWDNTPQQRGRSGKLITVPEPRVSFCAAISDSYLEEYTLAEDWTGGFLGRWYTIFARRERIDPYPQPHAGHRSWLVDELKKRGEAKDFGQCAGFDSGGHLLWSNWFHALMNRPLPSNVAGVRSRGPAIAMRIALALGWDYGEGYTKPGGTWLIGPDILEPALAITELYIRSIEQLSGLLADHEDGRLRRSVLRVVDEMNGHVSLADILERTKRRKKVIMETLDGLCAEGKLELITTARGPMYRYSPKQEA